MLNNFLFFFEETEKSNNWGTWVMLGILIVLIVVFMIFNARSKKKNKAAQDEMFKSYIPGSIVTTIGGIVGTIVSVDEINETFVVETGEGDNKTTMKFLKKAVYKIERPEEHKEVEEIVESFKNKAEKIWLKRMGREDTELWYEEVDFSDTEILIIEWTHGNSDNYKGVDIPVLLNSTPQETMAHRKARNRDGAVDSPFTTMVLELEQDMLESQAHKAKVIVSKAGKLLSYDEYKEIMDQGRI